MAQRTKDELETLLETHEDQISELLADNDTGDISEADSREVHESASSLLRDIIDSVQFTPTHEASHTRYFGWSDDATIATGDLASARAFAANEGALPARSGNGYVYYAVPESIGHPMAVFVGDNALVATPITEQAGTIDDAEGEPHLVGVSHFELAAALAGEAIRLEY